MTRANTLGAERAATQLEQMLVGHYIVQGLYVVTDLGIPDLLADSLKTSGELAEATGAHEPSLYRLLRLLASVGVFSRDANERFALTAVGGLLRRDTPGSLRDYVLLQALPAVWQALGDLRSTIMTGQSAFEHLYGKTFYEYAREQPALSAAFHGWMTSQSEQQNAAVVAAYDFSRLRLLVDVGGGRGATLAAILKATPNLRGILFDLPHVVGQPSLLEIGGVAERCEVEVIGGDMLSAVPAGGDAYLLKRILMDKSDKAASRVLRLCADAMADGGRVLVVDALIPPGDEPSTNKILDVRMLITTGGGRVRTETEFRRVFEAAGLQVTQMLPTASPNWIIEGRPV